MDRPSRIAAGTTIRGRLSRCSGESKLASFAELGFSLVEIVVVVAVLGVMFGLAAGVTMTTVKASRAESAKATVVTMLELARNQSTSERRDFQLIFTTPNRIQVVRLEIPSGTTPIADRVLEHGQEFVKFTGVPDTPDQFGNTTAISFGTTPTIRFTSDGTLIDSSGDVLNGSLFMGEPGKPESARAVTIFGASGLIRSWRWNGTTWEE
jgi:prepilin-type N-terminal cleavage/methylation domain-containing protein